MSNPEPVSETVNSFFFAVFPVAKAGKLDQLPINPT
jgi:hypothetical protein